MLVKKYKHLKNFKFMQPKSNKNQNIHNKRKLSYNAKHKQFTKSRHNLNKISHLQKLKRISISNKKINLKIMGKNQPVKNKKQRTFKSTSTKSAYLGYKLTKLKKYLKKNNIIKFRPVKKIRKYNSSKLLQKKYKIVMQKIKMVQTTASNSKIKLNKGQNNYKRKLNTIKKRRVFFPFKQKKNYKKNYIKTKKI